jgi:tRNA 2-selenouridine synthase
MRNAPVAVIELPFEVRVRRLVSDYGDNFYEGLETSLHKIERRLGNEALKLSLEKLQERDYAEVARITLHYYDKAYDFGLGNRESKDFSHFAFELDDMATIADSLIAYRKTRTEKTLLL